MNPMSPLFVKSALNRMGLFTGRFEYIVFEVFLINFSMLRVFWGRLYTSSLCF